MVRLSLTVFALGLVTGQLCGTQIDCGSCVAASGCVWKSNACWSASTFPSCNMDAACFQLGGSVCPIASAALYPSATAYVGASLPLASAYARPSVTPSVISAPLYSSTILPSVSAYGSADATVYTSPPVYVAPTVSASFAAAPSYPIYTSADVSAYPIYGNANLNTYANLGTSPAVYANTNLNANLGTLPTVYTNANLNANLGTLPAVYTNANLNANLNAYPTVYTNANLNANLNAYPAVYGNANLNTYPVYANANANLNAYPVYANVGVRLNGGGSDPSLFNFNGNVLGSTIRNNFYADALGDFIPGIGGAVTVANNYNLLANSPRLIDNVMSGNGYQRDPLRTYIRNDFYADALGDFIPGISGSLSALNQYNLYANLFN